MITKVFLPVALVALSLGVSVVGMQAVWATNEPVPSQPNAPRADGSECPGQVTCPITGELVCLDECPATAEQTLALKADRQDCPGQITCPITHALVCKDMCPLMTTAVEPAPAESPTCCLDSADVSADDPQE